jgi:SAM-dependent methyltransferase
VPGHTSEHHRSDDGGGPPDLDQVMDEAFWEERYRSSGAMWSGQPNVQLVAEAAGLPAGSALDVGCGEGADAMWLAARGWKVTAVDVSTVALARAAARAAGTSADLAARIDWQHTDLRSWAPADRYDLVSMQFMHPPPGLRDSLFRRLAVSVASGGTLLIVGHDISHRETISRGHDPALFFTGADVVAALDPARWRVVVNTVRGRDAAGPDGEAVTFYDTVVRAERLADRPD